MLNARKMTGILGISVLVSVSVIVFSFAQGQAVEPADFYAGKTGQIASGGRAGGGNDLLSRLLAPYLKEYTGATFVVRNKTRAGSVEAGNTVWKAKPDGLTLGTCTSLDLMLGSLMNAPGIIFDVGKLQYVGGVSNESMVLIGKAGGPYQTIDALKAAKNIFLGATHLTGNTGLASLTAIDVLNLDAKLIFDLKGSKGCFLALAQEEIAATAFPVGNAMEIVERGQGLALAIIGSERDPAIPNTPTLAELVDVTPEQKQVLETWTEILKVSKVFITTPGVPKERVEFLRKAVDRAFSTPKLVEDYAKVRGGIKQPYIPGKDWDQKVTALMKRGDFLRKIFADYIKPYTGQK